MSDIGLLEAARQAWLTFRQIPMGDRAENGHKALDALLGAIAEEMGYVATGKWMATVPEIERGDEIT